MLELLNPMRKIEQVVFSLHTSPQVSGRCEDDAILAIQTLTTSRACSYGELLRFSGPIIIYHYLPDTLVEADYHFVAYMDDKYIVDLARKPGNRVFNLQEYKRLIDQLQR